MVEDRTTDGRRIAELLASEVDGREDGELARFAVTNADRDVEPTADGARAYDLERDGERFARAFVHPERVHLEFEGGREAAVDAAEAAALRARPKATRPPKTLVFVESGAAVKRATDVLQAASRAAE
ncbi:hypothetical protein [Salinilacihabitans rarus]|uniref:hypothetical protein n=1 Tax=Salinilacihabitans rarus TaxID=2961596 RepID=UPI0020C8F2AB|nr:hypothetical protein [Salinilacihabitans rarus]